MTTIAMRVLILFALWRTERLMDAARRWHDRAKRWAEGQVGNASETEEFTGAPHSGGVSVILACTFREARHGWPP